MSILAVYLLSYKTSNGIKSCFWHGIMLRSFSMISSSGSISYQTASSCKHLPRVRALQRKQTGGARQHCWREEGGGTGDESTVPAGVVWFCFANGFDKHFRQSEYRSQYITSRSPLCTLTHIFFSVINLQF